MMLFLNGGSVFFRDFMTVSLRLLGMITSSWSIITNTPWNPADSFFRKQLRRRQGFATQALSTSVIVNVTFSLVLTVAVGHISSCIQQMQALLTFIHANFHTDSGARQSLPFVCLDSSSGDKTLQE